MLRLLKEHSRDVLGQAISTQVALTWHLRRSEAWEAARLLLQRQYEMTAEDLVVLDMSVEEVGLTMRCCSADRRLIEVCFEEFNAHRCEVSSWEDDFVLDLEAPEQLLAIMFVDDTSARTWFDRQVDEYEAREREFSRRLGDDYAETTLVEPEAAEKYHSEWLGSAIESFLDTTLGG